MPNYILPNFNILCNIYTYEPLSPTWPAIPLDAPRLANVACALVYGRRVNVMSTGGTLIPGVPIQAINLLLVKLTDIRGPQDNFGQDVVECPAGSGRWYGVAYVDDIGKGYVNEHRTACLFAIAGTWAAPYP
jgi:hypothetical protein